MYVRACALSFKGACVSCVHVGHMAEVLLFRFAVFTNKRRKEKEEEVVSSRALL